MNEKDIDVMYSMDTRRTPVSTAMVKYSPWNWRVIFARVCWLFS